MTRLTVIVAVVFIALGLQANGSPERNWLSFRTPICQYSHDDAGQMVRSVVPFAVRSRIRPATVGDVDVWCSRKFGNLSTMHIYGDCLRESLGPMAHTWADDWMKVYQETCKNYNTKREFLRQLDCFAVSSDNSLHNAYNLMLAIHDYTATQLPMEQRLVATCCNVQLYSYNLRKHLTRLCNRKMADAIVDGFDRAYANLLTYVCLNGETLDTCKRDAPDMYAAFLRFERNITTRTESPAEYFLHAVDTSRKAGLYDLHRKR